MACCLPLPERESVFFSLVGKYLSLTYNIFFKRIGFMATLRPLMAIYPAQMETTTSQDSNNNMASHRKYRMVALDLDGTLLNSKHELSDVTVDYLRSLNERGFVVAIATGR